MSFLAKVAALEASSFRQDCGLPPRAELASPVAFAAALTALGKLDGEVVNFYAHYEIDGDTSKHVLTLADYGGEGVGGWVLLKAA